MLPSCLAEPHHTEDFIHGLRWKELGAFWLPAITHISSFRWVEVNQNILQYVCNCSRTQEPRGLLLKGSKHLCDYHFDSQMLFIPCTLTSCWRPPPETRSASVLPPATPHPASKDQRGPAAGVLTHQLTYIHPPC